MYSERIDCICCSKEILSDDDLIVSTINCQFKPHCLACYTKKVEQKKLGFFVGKVQSSNTIIGIVIAAVFAIVLLFLPLRLFSIFIFGAILIDLFAWYKVGKYIFKSKSYDKLIINKTAMNRHDKHNLLQSNTGTFKTMNNEKQRFNDHLIYLEAEMNSEYGELKLSFIKSLLIDIAFVINYRLPFLKKLLIPLGFILYLVLFCIHFYLMSRLSLYLFST